MRTPRILKNLYKNLPEGLLIVTLSEVPSNIEGHYFSISFAEYKKSRGASPDHIEHDGKTYKMISAGSDSTYICENFPELQKYIHLHLAKCETGEPLYLVDNGFYFYSSKDFKSLSEHLRIPIEEAEKLSFEDKKDFVTYGATQKDRWASEAKELSEFILSL